MKKFLTVAAMLALVAMVATGCSKGSQTSTSSGESSTAASPAAASPAAAESSPAAAEASPAAVAVGGGDVAHGKTLFAANCASCHGADGSGGVGPNLHGDLKNPAMAKTQDAVVAWIKDPKPPMPKLYPGTLNEKDVNDVAAYVLATFK